MPSKSPIKSFTFPLASVLAFPSFLLSLSFVIPRRTLTIGSWFVGSGNFVGWFDDRDAAMFPALPLGRAGRSSRRAKWSVRGLVSWANVKGREVKSDEGLEVVVEGSGITHGVMVPGSPLYSNVDCEGGGFERVDDEARQGSGRSHRLTRILQTAASSANCVETK